MTDFYRRLWALLVRWFHVPDAPPEPPVVGPEERCDSFRPAPEFLRYLKTWFWIVLAIIDVALIALYVAAAAALIAEDLWWVALLLLPPTVALVVLPDLVAYVALHLRYDTTWYAMTDRSLRIRRGIWVIHEITITFENVQNVSVRQGPLERHFGISRLVVETAGAGGGGHEGSRRGVANQGVVEGVRDALALKERILGRLRRSRSAGLGDEETGGGGWTREHVDVLREIRDALA